MVVFELVLFLLNNIFVRSLVILDLGLSPALASVLRTKPLTLNFLLPSDSLRRGFPVAIPETTSADLQQAASVQHLASHAVVFRVIRRLP